MGAAALSLDTTLDSIALATRHPHRLADGGNDVIYEDIVRVPGQPVAAAGPAGAVDEPRLPQLKEELLEIFLADVLAGCDFGQRDGARAALLADIHHRHDRVS